MLDTIHLADSGQQLPTASQPMPRRGWALSISIVAHLAAAALLFTLQFHGARAILTPSSFHVTLLSPLSPPAPAHRTLTIATPPPITLAANPARAFSLPPSSLPAVSPQPILEVPAAPVLETVHANIPILPATQLPQLSAPPLRVDNLNPALPAPSPPIPATGRVVTGAGFTQGTIAGTAAKMQSAGVAMGSFGGTAQPAAASLRTASVRSGGFGDTQVAPAQNVAARVRADSGRPIEILAKPKPAYSEEARRLGIEGEVLVEMTFAASGEIRILRLVRGLGHGLDESALAAARAIRFRPAEQSGAAVDFTAIVHILFQLA